MASQFQRGDVDGIKKVYVLPLAAFVALFLILWGLLVLASPVARGGAARTAHLTAKLRSLDYLPVILVLAGGAAVTAGVGDAFIDLAEQVVEKSPSLQAIDQRWHEVAISERTPGDTTFFVAMSLVGGPLVLGVLTGTVAAALLLARRVPWALYVLATAAGGGALNGELKRHFARARPALAEMLRVAHGYSFPSGHTMESTVVMGALVYLSLRVLASWWQQAAAIAFAVAFVVAVAASRVYLGAHWLSDVGAGAAAGLLWLATTTIGYETFRRIRLVRAGRAR
jgi:undecaprenyl-diphosphatase